jgi:tripeptidyl-peptidase-1
VARGVTFVAAAGESGAHTSRDGDCSDVTAPVWPASSPWVLAVGATQLHNITAEREPRSPLCRAAARDGLLTGRCAKSGSERVASAANGSSITSGGGFSWLAQRPLWQDAAVSAYLSSGVPLPPAASFNADGRAVPDVAALGDNYIAWTGGQPSLHDGSSIATAVWAGIIALANAARAQVGLPRLGLANPLLYQLAAAPGTARVFHDVTVGNNACGRAPCAATCTEDKGFTAAPGWDPASGLGSPNVIEFIKAVAPGWEPPAPPPMPPADAAGAGPQLSSAAAVAVAAAAGAVLAAAVWQRV